MACERTETITTYLGNVGGSLRSAQHTINASKISAVGLKNIFSEPQMRPRIARSLILSNVFVTVQERQDLDSLMEDQLICSLGVNGVARYHI